MGIERLDHVNLRTAQLDTMISWYTDILGLRRGERPPFSSTGAWMYLGEHPIVHLVEVDGTGAVGSEANLKLEHFALSATDKAGFEAIIEAAGETSRCVDIPGLDRVQVNIWDPDGNHIHVDFPANE